CSVLEDPHHIFVDCPRFDIYRPHITSLLTQTVKGLTLDSEVWPLHRTFFYYGVIPALDQIIPSSSSNQPQNTCGARLRARLASEWHYGCIMLAARIWGTVRRVSTPYSSTSSASNRHTTISSTTTCPIPISLPSNLTFIVPTLSPSSKLR
ncbi:hypothetical protein BDZ97DRAFT_1960065, partial [Flammula alnicola]